MMYTFNVYNLSMYSVLIVYNANSAYNVYLHTSHILCKIACTVCIAQFAYSSYMCTNTMHRLHTTCTVFTMYTMFQCVGQDLRSANFKA